MNYYEKCINSFLSTVSSKMSALYLPVMFLSLIELLEDQYKFDVVYGEHIQVTNTRIKISYPLITSYFLSYLLRIRKEIPSIKMAPTKNRTHDDAFIEDQEGLLKDLTLPGQILYSSTFEQRGKIVLSRMRKSDNVFPVFERHCPILVCEKTHIEMDIAAVHALTSNSVLYARMGELICFQYLSRITYNYDLREKIEQYFIRGDSRVDFPNKAKSYVIDFQENRCYYCERVLDGSSSQSQARADHFIPWVFVKTSTLENLIYACNECNGTKLHRLPKLAYFNKLLHRNASNGDFISSYPELVPNWTERVERWVKNYHQASEQLSTGWGPL
ncbi:HNH endonuclease [Heliorestis acidaminivorans]|uniref:HNH endonuclease n=1 Tax=Heliorestis acidaminivorans TaxID=553427 RepID=A0A6I0EQ80_9FIRM|nr:HNH endonuclease [Heliorestis acidaminivorans]KAB2952167.1 HNH endonuclease [Heliorestis acidaminivorans]